MMIHFDRIQTFFGLEMISFLERVPGDEETDPCGTVDLLEVNKSESSRLIRLLIHDNLYISNSTEFAEEI